VNFSRMKNKDKKIPAIRMAGKGLLMGVKLIGLQPRIIIHNSYEQIMNKSGSF
jgi:hypothetical protein